MVLCALHTMLDRTATPKSASWEWEMSQLDADWLSVEFASAEAEVEHWSEGLRASLVNRELPEEANYKAAVEVGEENQVELRRCQ